LHSEAVAARLRQTKVHVIDPSAVPHISGWTQDDWLGFWEQVIATYAAEIVFIDGWEFSYGCAHEFWFAQSRQIRTCDERERRVSIADGMALIRAAVEILSRTGVSVSRLERVLGALAELPSTPSVSTSHLASGGDPRGK
jgi:hypothetical protein